MASQLRQIPLIATLWVSASAQASACQLLDLTPYQERIAKVQVTFVAIDLRSSVCWETNRADAAERHPPWSSFKIPHLLIALETKAVSSPDVLVPWDAARRPAADYWPPAWRQGQSLSSAFERSAAWYFQDLVSRVGNRSYVGWLDKFQYGNRQVPPGRDDFWLGGPLSISPKEQARFLACVATTGCGASANSVGTLEKVALSDVPGDGRIYGKTGSGPLLPGHFEGSFEGWYVGYIRTNDSTPVAAFALYARAASFSELRTSRQDIAVLLLRELKLWPT